MRGVFMGFLRKIKKFFIFIFFSLGLAGALVFFSLSEEESYKESCKDFGLECSRGKMHGSVMSFKAWLENFQENVETLEIIKFFDFSGEDESSKM